MTMKTEIEALFEKLAELQLLADAAGLGTDVAHAQYLAIAPQVPDAIRIESREARGL